MIRGAVASLCLLAVACEGEPRAADWVFELEESASLSEVIAIEARILAGVCPGGDELYRSEVSLASRPAAPRVLARGPYCFAGRARNASCEWFATGSTDVSLPLTRRMVVVRLLRDPGPDSQCSIDECVGGVCPPDPGGDDAGAVGCSGTTTRCGEACVDTSSDSNHCGGCFDDCGFGGVCVSGTCSSDCGPGLTDCPFDGCVDTSTDDDNCGRCDNDCDFGEDCEGGVCVPDCAPDETACGGSCTDTQTDRLNCGSCGNACGTGRVCIDGMCGCTGGRTFCSGSCVDTTTDDFNCGSCGVTCAANSSCNGVRCECDLGFTYCSAMCFDTQTSPLHCGACNNACPGGTSCVAGFCT